MAKLPEFKVDARTITGRKNKQLRKQGILPGIVYGKGFDSTMVQCNSLDFNRLHEEVGETGVFNLKINGEDKTIPVMIKNIAINQVSLEPIHFDLYKVNLKTKTTVVVPIKFTGEAPAVSELGAIFLPQMEEIEVEALPTDIPEEFVLDISSLKTLEDRLTTKNLKLPQGVSLVLEDEQVLAIVQEPKIEEEPEEEVTVEDVEVESKGKSDEAETEAEKPAESE